jgi:hypothetical protein
MYVPGCASLADPFAAPTAGGAGAVLAKREPEYHVTFVFIFDSDRTWSKYSRTYLRALTNVVSHVWFSDFQQERWP